MRRSAPPSASLSDSSPAAPKTTGDPSSPTSSTDTDEEKWFAGLKESRLEWDVPPVMVLGETRLMTVRIYGYSNAQSSADALPGATGGTPLKVATQMSAELLPANVDDLKIEPLDSASQKYVPATGFTDWSWNVTPLHSGKQETLRLTVYVILDSTHRRSFVTYSKPFTIKVADRSTAKDYAEDHFSSILKYLAPGGAGFLFLAGMVQWWRKRSKKPSPSNGG